MFFVFCLVAAVYLVPAYHDYLIEFEPERLTIPNFLASLFLVHYWGINFGHPWNGVSWTLSVEILGYIAFPFLAFVLVRIGSKRLILCLAAFCLLALGLILMATDNLDHNLKWRGGMLRMAFEFTAGILINLFFRKDGERDFAWGGTIAVGLILLSMSVHKLKFLIFPEFGCLILFLCYPRDLWERPSVIGQLYGLERSLSRSTWSTTTFIAPFSGLPNHTSSTSIPMRSVWCSSPQCL
jgi:peptidoglycan/LPS O-acetylase OafA/YrhL